MTTTYSIKHSHGITEYGYATYDDAVSAVRSVYRSASIGHSGDLQDSGGYTLVWADEESAQDDDGSRAVARIMESIIG